MFSHVGALESITRFCQQRYGWCQGQNTRRRRLTLKVGHVRPDVRVQGIDDHLAVGWAGDLNPAVDQARSWRGTLPCSVLSDVLRLGKEVRQHAAVQLALADDAALEQGLAGGIERAVQQGEEGEGIGGQDLALGILDVTQHINTLEDRFGGRHRA